MKNLRSIFKLEKAALAFTRFTRGEKIIFSILSLVMLMSVVVMLLQVQRHFSVEIPRRGGEFKEGVIGSPRFINPLIASSQTDRDLVSLIYSGLLRTNEEGNLIPDLAESFSISEDGLQYTFTIRENATFHDGSPVKADDVVFTIQKALDPSIKSPKRANWEGITVEATDQRNVTFTLTQPYAPFLNNMTLGILPQHIWEHISPEEFSFNRYNIEPIGSGPFRVAHITYDDAGNAASYTLEAFKKFTLGRAYLDSITMSFFSNEEELVDAFKNGDIQSVYGVAPHTMDVYKDSQDVRIIAQELPRVFGIFFNQNKSTALADSSVRQALTLATDRSEIVQKALFGFGKVITSTIPQPEDQIALYNPEKATSILDKAGWSVGDDGFRTKKTKAGNEELTITISTGNIADLVASAELLKTQWEKIGVRVILQTFEPAELRQNVIRTREFESLLFGQIIGHDPDLYAFWHSSQRNDPGLNVASYTNIIADRALEKARKTHDPIEKQEAFETFQEQFESDIPAIFLYSPDFIYVVPASLGDTPFGPLNTPSDRFSMIHTWHMEKDTVWKVFAQ